jgi:hypothetical protein
MRFRKRGGFSLGAGEGLGRSAPGREAVFGRPRRGCGAQG